MIRDWTHLVHYLNHHSQILFMILDNTGIIQHANRFADHYIGGPVTGKPFQKLIRDFHQTFQLDQAVTCPDTAHLLELHTPSGISHTCRFHFFASAGQVLALGHLDVEEISRLSDELVARFGGEEFIILMPLADVQEAFASAERIRCALAESDLLENGEPVTASFGIAGLGVDETVDEIIKRADTALYQAKTSGRNRVVIASGPSLKNGSDSI